MPWLSKNSAMKLAGKLHICSGSADQTAEAWGTISRSTNLREKPCWSSQSPSDGAAPSIPISVFASRLKRKKSRSMPRKAGLTRWAGRAKRPDGVPAYSNLPRPSATEKLICEGCEGTPSSRSSRSKFG